MALERIAREYERFKRRLFRSGAVHKQLERLEYRLANQPYELYDRFVRGDLTLALPQIRPAEQTVEAIVAGGRSLSRFGDGEFVLMAGGRIHYQQGSPAIAGRLAEVIRSREADLLIALPPCFGSLDHFLEPVAEFWVKWMARRRQQVYEYLDMERVYYDAFFSRVYMGGVKTEAHSAQCRVYYEQVRRIWAGRRVVICEGEGTRFGVMNDLLGDAAEVRRILCPARNAFDRYDEILAAFDAVPTDRLILVALGPTATILAHDLCRRGYQAIDVGAMDLDYEWFLRRETRLGAPLEFKYVDSDEGRRIPIAPLDDPAYQGQIIKRVGC